MGKTTYLKGTFQYSGLESDEYETNRPDEILIRKDKSENRNWLETGQILKIIPLDKPRGKILYRRVRLAKGKLKNNQIAISYHDSKKLVGGREKMAVANEINLDISPSGIFGIFIFYFHHPFQEIRIQTLGIIFAIMTLILAFIDYSIRIYLFLQ